MFAFFEQEILLLVAGGEKHRDIRTFTDSKSSVRESVEE